MFQNRTLTSKPAKPAKGGLLKLLKLLKLACVGKTETVRVHPCQQRRSQTHARRTPSELPRSESSGRSRCAQRLPVASKSREPHEGHAVERNHGSASRAKHRTSDACPTSGGVRILEWKSSNLASKRKGLPRTGFIPMVTFQHTALSPVYSFVITSNNKH